MLKEAIFSVVKYFVVLKIGQFKGPESKEVYFNKQHFISKKQGKQLQQKNSPKILHCSFNVFFKIERGCDFYLLLLIIVTIANSRK